MDWEASRSTRRTKKGRPPSSKEHEELLATEVEIEYKPIKLSELEKNGIELSPAERKAIMRLRCPELTL